MTTRLSDESIDLTMSRRVCLMCNHWYRPLETDTARLCFVCRRGVVRATPDSVSRSDVGGPRVRIRSATEILRALTDEVTKIEKRPATRESDGA